MKASLIIPIVTLALSILPQGAYGQQGDHEQAPIVVIDAGHGGDDLGARGRAGLVEKELVLSVANLLGSALQKRGVVVFYTRERDEFVPLAARVQLANRAKADLFLSIHANAAPDTRVSGSESYFLSLDASDAEAMRVAMTENAVYKQEGTNPEGADIVGSILGDLIRTDHLRGSSRVASAIQRKLAPLSGDSRGVKQAPFVVLMGVNMPAALIEIGFLTHPAEERRLKQGKHQRAIATAIADAVEHTLTTPPADAAPMEMME
ncbi:MAG: N-acetylmuramoyl-L-alanine amidase [bacterium]|nr:N-acetylmuramoyl-L-alanine amidase [bacterium]